MSIRCLFQCTPLSSQLVVGLNPMKEGGFVQSVHFNYGKPRLYVASWGDWTGKNPLKVVQCTAKLLVQVAPALCMVGCWKTFCGSGMYTWTLVIGIHPLLTTTKNLSPDQTDL